MGLCRSPHLPGKSAATVDDQLNRTMGWACTLPQSAHSCGFALCFIVAEIVLSLNVQLCLKRQYLAQVLLKQSSAVPQPHNFCLVQGTDMQVGVMRWKIKRELHVLNQRPAVRSIAPLWSGCTTFSSTLH